MLTEPGASIWREVRARIEGVDLSPVESRIREIVGPSPTLGKEYLSRARLGQGAFRMMTIENFKHKCCITGETTGPVLQAAHINPISNDGKHSIRNGLLLRADLHILYDRGLVGVDHAYRVRISPRIKDLYLNGRVYYSHDGERLRSLPAAKELRPDPELLDWHMEIIFKR
jgi:putative restriction endonuclease